MNINVIRASGSESEQRCSPYPIFDGGFEGRELRIERSHGIDDVPAQVNARSVDVGGGSPAGQGGAGLADRRLGDRARERVAAHHGNRTGPVTVRQRSGTGGSLLRVCHRGELAQPVGTGDAVATDEHGVTLALVESAVV